VTSDHDLFIDHYRRRLLLLERVLSHRLDTDFALGGVVSAERPPFDARQVAALADATFALAETEAAVLAQVRAALQRIDDGTFGCCVVDGEPIDPNRLESVPWTPFCIVHQRELEVRARTKPVASL
jgi:RNA polymerase-binding transcription factor DksA